MSICQLLLIEDSPAEVLLFREALRRVPQVIHVTIAYNGEQAMELLRDPAFHADLVVLDLNLPTLGGHAILEQANFADGPPVVVFSVSENPLDRERALKLGARDYIVKPRTVDEYSAAVHGIIQRWLAPVNGLSTGIG